MVTVSFSKQTFCANFDQRDQLYVLVTGTRDQARELFSNRHQQVDHQIVQDGEFLAADECVDAKGNSDGWVRVVKFQMNVFLFLSPEDYEQLFQELQKEFGMLR